MTRFVVEATIGRAGGKGAGPAGEGGGRVVTGRIAVAGIRTVEVIAHIVEQQPPRHGIDHQMMGDDQQPVGL